MTIPKEESFILPEKGQSADNIPFLLEVIFICPTVNCWTYSSLLLRFSRIGGIPVRMTAGIFFLTCEGWGITMETKLKETQTMTVCIQEKVRRPGCSPVLPLSTDSSGTGRGRMYLPPPFPVRATDASPAVSARRAV